MGVIATDPKLANSKPLEIPKKCIFCDKPVEDWEAQMAVQVVYGGLDALGQGQVVVKKRGRGVLVWHNVCDVPEWLREEWRLNQKP